MMSTAVQVPDYIQKVLKRAGITPRGIQRTALEKGLLDGKSIMVSSPTGSGKTLIGELALLRAVTDGGKGLYLVPFRALAVQVAEIFRERYETSGVKVGISTGDFETDGEQLAKFDILVTTYERADSLLRRGVGWLPDTKTVVIDEIQSLSEPYRGARLESFIIRIRKLIDDIQIIALSATVGAPDEVAEWLGCDLVESDQRPVPLTFKVVQTKNRAQTIKQLVMTTIQGDGQAIVFHRTRRDAEASAARLSSEVGRQFTSAEKEELDRELDSIENLNVRIPADLRSLLRHGTAYHHAGLGYSARMLVERLFAKGMVRAISATTTLAAGMDLPARTVVLSTARSPTSHQSLLSANTTHQMLGRAGRPGYDSKGFGIILVGSTGEAEEVQRAYFETTRDPDSNSAVYIPKYDRVHSTLDNSSSLAEQLLVLLDMLDEASIEEIEEGIFGESYLVFLGIRDSRAPMKLLHLGETTAEHTMERHSLVETIRPARQGVLGTVKLREKNETVIGGIVSAWDQGSFTSRFSARVTPSGAVEGPQCSCSNPVDSHGILCPHLVALGMEASRTLGGLADYVIPIALGETSPCETLVRLGLIEGGDSGRFRPTHLGRVTNRLYLSIPAVRELLALLPTTQDSSGLLWLLRHLVSIEASTSLDEKFDHMIAALATTDIPMKHLAIEAGIHEGDVYSLIETSRWLLYSIIAISEIGGLELPMNLAASLLGNIDTRLKKSHGSGRTNENEERQI
ncbi:MAG: DEAD/DEAH box helicase [Promethearchaeota archaeon]